MRDAKQMYLLSISLSDCWCINWWLTVFSGLSAKLCVFMLAQKRKKKPATQKRDKQTVTKMETIVAISSFREITGEVHCCCWTRKHQPMGCFHWPSFLLQCVLHFSLAVCAFSVGDSLSFYPRGSNFLCRPLAGHAVKPPRTSLPHLCSTPQSAFTQYVLVCV